MSVTFTTEERLALLLHVLGDEVAAGALNSMSGNRAIVIRQLLNEFKADPPSNEEIEYVIGDFNQYFQFAMQALGTDLTAGNSKRKSDKPKESGTKSTFTYFEKMHPTADPIADLNRLDAFQIAAAIGGDHPKTIALVLRNIDVSHAAGVLEQLPNAVRSEAVIFLTRESTVPTPIVNQVLKTTVQKAVTVEFREETVDRSLVLAELLRSLPKDMRVDLMTEMEKSDPDLAKQIRAKLYVFADVLRLDDRDVQKLLGEIDSDSLIVSLQRCEQEMLDKLLNNLSKRARESIIEEMEFKQGVTDEEIETSRKQLVAGLARLDEAGQIKLS